MKTNTKTLITSKLTRFRNFLYVTWKHLNLPQPTPVQYDSCKLPTERPAVWLSKRFVGLVNRI